VNSGGGVFGALIFVIGILLAFAVMFGFFLIVPFFIFLAGVVVMLVSDRRDSGGGNGDSAKKTETAETTEVVREVKS
jgi:hypothetical protein